MIAEKTALALDETSWEQCPSHVGIVPVQETELGHEHFSETEL